MLLLLTSNFVEHRLGTLITKHYAPMEISKRIVFTICFMIVSGTQSTSALALPTSMTIYVLSSAGSKMDSVARRFADYLQRTKGITAQIYNGGIAQVSNGGVRNVAHGPTMQLALNSANDGSNLIITLKSNLDVAKASEVIGTLASAAAPDGIATYDLFVPAGAMTKISEELRTVLRSAVSDPTFGTALAALDASPAAPSSTVVSAQAQSDAARQSLINREAELDRQIAQGQANLERARAEDRAALLSGIGAIAGALAAQNKNAPPQRNVDIATSPPQANTVASCNQEIRSIQSTSGSLLVMNQRQKSLFEGRCASHPEASVYVNNATRSIAEIQAQGQSAGSANSSSSRASISESNDRKIWVGEVTSNCVRYQALPRKNDSTTQWFEFENGCNEAVHVYYSDQPSGIIGTMSDLKSHGKSKSWFLTTTISEIRNVVACRASEMGKTVYLDKTVLRCFRYQ